jgi:PIN domain nuclease of toxin-antitoxin system
LSGVRIAFFGVNIISCWEVAKLVQYGRLKLDRGVGVWIERALAEPGLDPARKLRYRAFRFLTVAAR